MPLKTVAEEYSVKATAHGVSYIFEKESKGPRIFWFIVVLGSLAISSFLIYKVCKQWYDDPIVTTIKSTGNEYKKSKRETATVTKSALI